MRNAATKASSPASAPLASVRGAIFSAIPLRTNEPAGSFRTGMLALPCPPGRSTRLGDRGAAQPVRGSVPREQLSGEIRAGQLALSPHHIVQGLVAVAECLGALEGEASAHD